MSVYVDNAKHRYGRLILCHMFADTTEELLAMTEKIGVATCWVQAADTTHEHFDICKTKRALTVSHGAIQVTLGELARMLAEKKLKSLLELRR